jgi:hypothetical protein
MLYETGKRLECRCIIDSFQNVLGAVFKMSGMDSCMVFSTMAALRTLRW